MAHAFLKVPPPQAAVKVTAPTGARFRRAAALVVDWLRDRRSREHGRVRSRSVPVVRELMGDDRPWVARTLTRVWTSTVVARLGVLVDAAGLPGFVAVVDGRRAGLVLHSVEGGDDEVVAIITTRPHLGVGRALMERCFEQARALGCRRVWLVTTNDNIAAIAFYQHLGMDLRAVHRHGVRRSRAVKPSIPLHDRAGIPIEHELEFELVLPA